jgi:hypothetical protein
MEAAKAPATASETVAFTFISIERTREQRDDDNGHFLSATRRRRR